MENCNERNRRGEMLVRKILPSISEFSSVNGEYTSNRT